MIKKILRKFENFFFEKREFNKIIITRPTVSTEDNGFLPGSEREKMEPQVKC